MENAIAKAYTAVAFGHSGSVINYFTFRMESCSCMCSCMAVNARLPETDVQLQRTRDL